jgi:hypothetical protein
VRSSNDPLSDKAHKELLAKIKALKAANAKKGIVSPRLRSAVGSGNEPPHDQPRVHGQVQGLAGVRRT